MKTRKTVTLTVVAALMLLLAGGVGLVWAQGAPLGYAFTYQGQLMDDGNPATGSYDFQFDLYDHPSSGAKVGGPLNPEDIEVNEGLFTVPLDFGPTAFTGEARWLEIGVRAGDSGGDYTTLAPRQQVTAAPYALHSLSTGALQGHPISNTMPTPGQLLQWNGSAWQPATVNQPPVAVLQAGPTMLTAGVTTTLELGLSYDPEGGPLTYAFDFIGQMMGPPSTYVVTPTTVVCAEDYPGPGYYMAAGWAKDGAGHFDVARALVEVHGFWPTIVDSGGDVGQHASLAVVDGNPAIAYYDNTNDDLIYVRALDTSGLYWGTPVTVTASGDVGQYASLAVVDGRPAIAYAYYEESPTNYDLKYVRANDATGSSWGTPLTVDSAGYVGLYASLAVVDGRPAIAYLDNYANDLKYARASDATGSSWGTPVTVDSTDAVGWFASMKVVDGYPAIAYLDGNYGDLLYVRATNASGSSWGTPLTVASADADGYYASLAVVDGRPAIAYHHLGTALKYVRAGDAAGSSWGSPLTLDSSGDVGRYASLAVVDGRPAIAYYDATNDDLKYVRARDASGSSWDTPVTVDSTGDVGQYASLAVVNDRAAIAYYDATNGDLRYAIYQ